MKNSFERNSGEFDRSKNNNLELISNIKIGLSEWTRKEKVGGPWESNDGMMAGNDRRTIEVGCAGFKIEFNNEVIFVDSENQDEIIKKLSIRSDNTFSQEESLKIKEKFPKLTLVHDPFIVEKKKWSGFQLSYEEIKLNTEIHEKLRGLKVGQAIFRNKNIDKDKYTYGEYFFVDSEIKKIISRQDAERRNIPGIPHNGPLLVNFPEKTELFNEIKSIIREKVDDELYGDRTLEAEVSLERNQSNRYLIGYNDICYKIKNVPTKINEYEEIKNLDSGEVSKKFLGEKEILEDKYVYEKIPSDQQPLKNGTYTIKYIVPTRGKDRGRGDYHIMTDEIKSASKESYKKKADDPHQIELAKSAIKMNDLVSDHNTQKDLLMYAVKREDGLWYPHVGEPFHLYPLKGYKSKMSAKTSEELIKMYENSGYRKLKKD